MSYSLQSLTVAWKQRKSEGESADNAIRWLELDLKQKASVGKVTKDSFSQNHCCLCPCMPFSTKRMQYMTKILSRELFEC